MQPESISSSGQSSMSTNRSSEHAPQHARSEQSPAPEGRNPSATGKNSDRNPALDVRRLITPAAPLSNPSFEPPRPPGPQPSRAEVLLSGTLLREERYSLQHIVSHQQWRPGTVETMWVAQDAQRSGSSVMIYELHIPDCGLIEMQALLRRATISLTSIGRYPRIPTLWDVFSEHPRHFFVFEPVDGESLSARMLRTGQLFTETEAIECAIQVAETLDFLSQQSLPLIHGHIRPDFIVASRQSATYLLTNFSPLLAADATQFIIGMPLNHLSPFSSPGFIQKPGDNRYDLYALIATLYYILTGHLPTGDTNMLPPSARDFNPTVSAEGVAILEKGLHPVTAQRYQSAATLLADLRALRSVRDSRFQQSGSLASVRRIRNSGRFPAVPRQTSPVVQEIKNKPLPSVSSSSSGPIQTHISGSGPIISQPSGSGPMKPSLPTGGPVPPTSTSGVHEDLMSKLMESQLQELSFWQKHSRSRFLLFWGIAVALLVLVVLILNIIVSH